ncbi:uncharacterized protein CXorf38-like isoform X2 [Mya arenaria]|uniref:uncharacterized protein CXorf38-like isoform X2 n=1 Tax=Mya arenaria TaxID=6604 RepID=UPI0022DF5BE3|nr:uncharacterized protein CXorf38-like isoform X2 [Mya arenaria]
MSKTTDINQPESRNWLKQWRAVFITRQALLLIVSEVADQLHGDLVNRLPVPACITCSSKDVLKKNSSCRYHNDFRDELVKEHAYGQARGIGALTLKNTKAENWAHSAWELVKVFMPPGGYENKTAIEETDFNGIAGFIINCKRFQGKITGSICEKAREVVNHIRHMPDSSSSALTDQATTECIDNLYALLNETGLKTRPEAIQARKQLDELKTADLSKDEDTRKYICKEMHDGFGQRLADIEMKLQAKEIDIKSAKADLHSYSQGVLEAFKLVSDDTMHDLSKTKDKILLLIKDERRRIMDHIAIKERKATKHIEQSTRDGQRTLDKTVTEGKRTLEDHTEILTRRLRKEGVETLPKKKLVWAQMIKTQC